MNLGAWIMNGCSIPVLGTYLIPIRSWIWARVSYGLTMVGFCEGTGKSTNDIYP